MFNKDYIIEETATKRIEFVYLEEPCSVNTKNKDIQQNEIITL